MFLRFSVRRASVRSRVVHLCRSPPPLPSLLKKRHVCLIPVNNSLGVGTAAPLWRNIPTTCAMCQYLHVEQRNHCSLFAWHDNVSRRQTTSSVCLKEQWLMIPQWQKPLALRQINKSIKASNICRIPEHLCLNFGNVNLLRSFALKPQHWLVRDVLHGKWEVEPYQTLTLPNFRSFY